MYDQYRILYIQYLNAHIQKNLYTKSAQSRVWQQAPTFFLATDIIVIALF